MAIDYRESSLEEILSVSVALDQACNRLDELPESEHLSDIIDGITSYVARLDAILKDSGF